MNPQDVLTLLKSREFKQFSWFIGIGVVVVVGSTVYNRYYSNKVLSQQSKINKYVLANWKNQFSTANQQVIETNPAFT